MAAVGPPASENGRITPESTVTRVMLRPIGSPLPLGAFTLVPAGVMLRDLETEAGVREQL